MTGFEGLLRRQKADTVITAKILQILHGKLQVRFGEVTIWVGYRASDFGNLSPGDYVSLLRSGGVYRVIRQAAVSQS